MSFLGESKAATGPMDESGEPVLTHADMYFKITKKVRDILKELAETTGDKTLEQQVQFVILKTDVHGETRGTISVAGLSAEVSADAILRVAEREAGIVYVLPSRGYVTYEMFAENPTK
jgi:hypothetical protein